MQAEMNPVVPGRVVNGRHPAISAKAHADRANSTAKQGAQPGTAFHADACVDAAGAAAEADAVGVVAALTRHATLHSAPHHRMVVSKYNVRNKQTNLAELKALVRAHGVLQNLIGYPQVVNGAPTGIIEIVGGGRRHTVVGELIAEGDLPDDYQLNYLLVTEAEAIEISLAENHGRAEMHPADVYEAMLALSRAGRAIADIALAFRLTPLEVQRRLKLANVAPRLFALYRADDASFDQMMALAVSDDHTAQDQAWDSLPRYQRSPHDLRRLLTAQQINVKTDRMARFVGVAALEKAGGVVKRDLFSDSGAGYTADAALLERLALDKLERQRPKLFKEGARWVQIMPRADHAMLAEFGRVRSVPQELSAQQQAWAAALDERIDVLAQRIAGMEQGGDSDEALLAKLEAERDELAAQRRAIDSSRVSVPHPADDALSGVVLTLDADGAVQVHRGLIRPSDKAKMAPLPGAGSARVAVRVKPAHSDRLTHELTSERTAALQAAMADQSGVALVFVTYTLMRKVLASRQRDTLVKIDVTTPVLAGVAREGRAAAAFAARREQLLAQLPRDDHGDGWLAWLAAQPQLVVLAMLAYCVAATLDATQHREGASPDFADLARLLQLDMTQWWRPTAANYFSQIAKDRILTVVKQAVSPEAAVPLEKMTRAAAAEAAARAMAESSWLPPALCVD